VTTATVTLDNGDTATVTRWRDTGHAMYDLGPDVGKVLAQHGYYGQPDRPAVTLSLGRPGQTSGYRLAGIQFGGWLLTGTAWCTGEDLLPQPHPHSPGAFPLDGMEHDPLSRDFAAELLTAIARHFYDNR
jgi:hypothetical protein